MGEYYKVTITDYVYADSGFDAMHFAILDKSDAEAEVVDREEAVKMCPWLIVDEVGDEEDWPGDEDEEEDLD